ncbi:MAG: hypothetical protein ACK40G_05395 [Cytophagaceae bacterium]
MMKAWKEIVALVGGLTAGYMMVKGILYVATWLDQRKEWEIREGWKKRRIHDWVPYTRLLATSKKEWSPQYR